MTSLEADVSNKTAPVTTKFEAMKAWAYEHRRPLMAFFALVAVIALIIGLSLSWFVANKSLSTVGKIEGPATLKIKGPNQTAMEQMDLTFDADNDATTKDANGKEIVTRKRAFCVESQGQGFELQIANTTNIKDLDIKVYRAKDVTSSPDGADVVGRDGINNYYAWEKGSEVTGFTTINEDASTAGIATSDKLAQNYDSQTFGDYGNVQKNARTLYRWKAISVDDLDSKEETGATKYIIECSWPKATNIKETDVVYVIARSLSGDTTGN